MVIASAAEPAAEQAEKAEEDNNGETEGGGEA
jgi:hypothetical protein